jgi:copper chaperone CopZ
MKYPLKGVILALPLLFVVGAALEQPIQTEKVSYDVDGMKSSSDAEMIEKELKGMMGLISIQCDYSEGRCQAEIDPSNVRKEDVAVQINKLGFQAFLR